MKNVDRFAELISQEEIEDKLRDEGKKAYREAMTAGRPDTSFRDVVLLTIAGEVHRGTYQNNSFCSSVFEGRAIEVMSFDWFDAAAGDDFSYFPEQDAFFLSRKEEKEAFLAWCRERREEPNPCLLKEYDEKLAEEYWEDYIDNYADATEDDAVAEQLQNINEDINEEIRMREGI